MTLFKYREISRTSIFTTCELIFSPPSKFSDPFECRPKSKSPDDDKDFQRRILSHYSNSMKKEILLHVSKLSELKSMTSDQIQQQVDAFIQSYIDDRILKPSSLFDIILRKKIDDIVYSADDTDIGILSLTSSNDNQVMWAQYAGMHTGFAIGFNTNDEFFNVLDDGIGTPMKVCYSTERPTWLMSDIQFSRYLTKSMDFMYEQEWRVLRKLSDGVKLETTTNDSIADLKPPLSRFRFNPSAVSEVILGANMDIEERFKLVHYLHNDPKWKHVQLFIARPDPSEYKMNIDPLPDLYYTYQDQVLD